VKILVAIAFSFIYIFAIEPKGDISIEQTNNKNSTNSKSIYGNIKFESSSDIFDFKSNIEYLYDNKYSNRKYINLNEFYISKDYENSRVIVGKIIKFWGELEGYNITDIFNPKNYLFDSFNKDIKLGAYNMAYIYYSDESSFEIGAKLYEDENEFQDFGKVALNSTHSKHRPTTYIKYDFSTQDFLESENKIILWSGYDNKRYLLSKNNQLFEHVYLSNKFMFFSNIVYEDMIFKMEYSYSDVDEVLISDYSQFGIGVENSFYDIGGFDLSSYLEYYNYQYKDNSKLKNINISEVYDNDMFFALKLNFNNTSSSELKSGLFYDIKNYEKMFKTEFKSRIVDGVNIKLEYLDIISKSNNSIIKNDTTKLKLALIYSF
jgi:hypothetical protein